MCSGCSGDQEALVFLVLWLVPGPVVSLSVFMKIPKDCTAHPSAAGGGHLEQEWFLLLSDLSHHSLELLEESMEEALASCRGKGHLVGCTCLRPRTWGLIPLSTLVVAANSGRLWLVGFVFLDCIVKELETSLIIWSRTFNDSIARYACQSCVLVSSPSLECR